MQKIKFELLTTGLEPVALPNNMGLWYRLSDIGLALKKNGVDYKSLGFNLKTYVVKGGFEILVDNVNFKLPVYYARPKFHKKTGLFKRVLSFINPWGKCRKAFPHGHCLTAVGCPTA